MEGIGWSAYDHYGFAAIVLLGTLAAGIGFVLIVAAPTRPAWVATLDGVAPPFINIIGVLFALTLAFLANDTWSAHDRATDAVHREADNLRALVALTREAGEAERAAIDATVATYARTTIEEEWPLLGRRLTSAAAEATLDRLLGLVAMPAVGGRLGQAVHAQVLGLAVEVRALRDRRVALSQTHVNPLKWLGMAFLGLVTMASVAVVHVHSPRAAFVGVVLFALAAAPTAAIVLVQGNPFQPPTAVSPAPFTALLALAGEAASH